MNSSSKLSNLMSLRSTSAGLSTAYLFCR